MNSAKSILLLAAVATAAAYLSPQGHPVAPAASATPTALGRPLTTQETQATNAVALAFVAGKVCPRYQMLTMGMVDAWNNAGMAHDVTGSQEYKDAGDKAFLNAQALFAQHPNEYCIAAWQQFGTSGTYRVQLLETK